MSRISEYCSNFRPAASGVLVRVSVCACVLVTVGGLTDRSAVAILTRRAVRRAPTCGVHLTCRSLRGRLVLAVCGIAVFRNCRGSVASIGIRSLHSRGRSPGPWVVRLTGARAAVAVRYSGAASVSPRGWVIACAGVCAPVWSVGTRTGSVVATVPRAVSVVGAAVIHHRGGAVPAAVPTAISPTATSTAHHRAYRDADAKRNHGGCCHGGGAVSRSYIGVAVNDRRVVHRDVDDLRIR